MNVFINFFPYTRKNESILEKNKVSDKAGKMISENANSRSHVRKINEKIRRKLGRHTSYSLMQLPAK